MTISKLPMITLKNVICRHKLKILSKYGKQFIIVFFDTRDKETYIWATSTQPEYEEGKTYSIKARCECTRLYQVKSIIEPEVKSEQEYPDALDILLPDTNLTYDEKYDIIKMKGDN